MAAGGHERQPRTHDDSALAHPGQRHLEQIALPRGRAGNQTSVAGHHLQLGDVVDLCPEALARGAQPTDAQGSADTQGHRVRHDGRDQAFRQAGLDHIAPGRACLRINGAIGRALHAVQRARINDNARFRLGLAVARMALALHNRLERVTVRAPTPA